MFKLSWVSMQTTECIAYQVGRGFMASIEYEDAVLQQFGVAQLTLVAKHQAR